MSEHGGNGYGPGGITDPVSNEEVEEKEIICARCGKKIEPFRPF
jgi:hypothetical protein